MEKIVYFIVKCGILSYILYQMWLFLFRKNGLRFFLKYLNPKETKKISTPAVPVKEEDEISIVGKSHTIYLDALPESSEAEPIMSIDLESTDYIGEDEDLSADDAEIEIRQVNVDDIMDESERFIPFEENDLPDLNFSSGMTYEDISNAVDVIKGEKRGEEDQRNAARLLYEVKQTDMMNFFSAQAGNMEVIELLLNENLDESGIPLPQRNNKKSSISMTDFDINKYV